MSQRQSRPGGTTRAASDVEDNDTTSLADATDAVAQMRRRRGVACRSAILDHGTGDPLDRIAREPLPSTTRNVEAARSAWCHLRDHGLMSEHVEAVLAEAVGA